MGKNAMGKTALATSGKKSALAPLSNEEEDQLFCSSKKVKNNLKQIEDNVHQGEWPVLGSNIRIYHEGGPSFLDKLKGSNNKESNGQKEDDSLSEDSLSEDENGTGNVDPFCVTKEDPERNIPTFSFSEKMKKRLCKPWKSAVIVKLLGRQIGYKSLVQRLQSMWARKGILNVINVGFGYFVVKLSNREDYLNALTGGPWMIFDHYLTVQPWEPGFKAHKATISKVAVWVRIPKLYMEYYDEDALTCIGNRIGKTLKVDMNTSCQLRGHFARICVLVELGKQLMAGFRLDGEEHFLEYEGLHLLCTKCGIYGHRQDTCSLRNITNVNNEEIRDKEGDKRLDSGDRGMEKYSDQWKVVEKRRIQKTRDKNGDQAPVTKSGSRFNVLHVAANDNDVIQEATALSSVPVMIQDETTAINQSTKLRTQEKLQMGHSFPRRAMTKNLDMDSIEEQRRSADGTDGQLRRVIGGRVQKRGNNKKADKRLRRDINFAETVDETHKKLSDNALLLTFGEELVGPGEKMITEGMNEGAMDDGSLLPRMQVENIVNSNTSMGFNDNGLVWGGHLPPQKSFLRLPRQNSSHIFTSKSVPVLPTNYPNKLTLAK